MTESDNMLYQRCYEIVEHVAKRKGFSEFDIEINSGSSKGDNFMGEIYTVTVKELKSINRVLHLVVKMAPAHGIRDEVPIEIWYNREIVAYKEVFKVLKELQDNFKVNAALKFDFVDCFFSSSEFMKELIVFENIKTQGFEILGRKNCVEFEHAELVLSAVAKLHALSFILQKQRPDQFNELARKVPDFLAGQKIYEDFLEKSLNLAINSLKNPRYKEKLIQFTKNYKEITRKCLDVDKYSTLCHGDCWINNAMFKQQDGKPVEVRLIDYQMFRYGPPCVDILYFLFTSTDGEFRRSHYRSCLDHYYNSLSVALQQFHYDVDDIFPRDEFDKQIERIALYGVSAGIAFCKPMILEGDESLDITDLVDPNQLAAPKGNALDRYLKRVTELVHDSIQYGYL